MLLPMLLRPTLHLPPKSSLTSSSSNNPCGSISRSATQEANVPHGSQETQTLEEKEDEEKLSIIDQRMELLEITHEPADPLPF
ncbi:hypothetical protein AMTR_s00050p00041270 [Amborella trichopoda]|uniref:Uncharacterized protein n=1 Tax=Amborella trichopoda TaxID=13333 RepID=W1PS62_AMBTC|nr:hypothetical protein AMTR_s00050p00041270 [Amborella trichopoda]